jgi:hypothetical protein
MSNIIEFPEERRIKLKLDESKKGLKDLYDSLKLCYDTIDTIEKKIEGEEYSYDMLFTQYAKAVGVDNIEIEYIEWVSGEVVLNVETGEILYGVEVTEEDPKTP